jgi:hypothetical protein
MIKKNERFSFKEMEHIAVEFAISCVKGYKGSFEDYMLTVHKDWRVILKTVSKQETNIKDYHRMITTPYFLCRDLKISKSNIRDSDCNCGQPSCSLCG